MKYKITDAFGGQVIVDGVNDRNAVLSTMLDATGRQVLVSVIPAPYTVTWVGKSETFHAKFYVLDEAIEALAEKTLQSQWLEVTLEYRRG